MRLMRATPARTGESSGLEAGNKGNNFIAQGCGGFRFPK